MTGDFVRSLIWLFSCNGLFLLGYVALRTEYLVWNRVALGPFTWPDIARAYLYGLQFDASAVFTLSALPLVMVLVPVPGRMRRRRLRVAAAACFVLQVPFLVLNAVDLELVNFVGHRATRDTLLLAREVPGKLLSFVLPYGRLWILNIALLACLAVAFLRLTRRWSPPAGDAGSAAARGPADAGRRCARPGLGRAAALAALAILVYVLGIRGVHSKSLTFAHANVFPAPALNGLVLNSSFTLLQSFLAPGIGRLEYFRDRSEMISLLNGQLPGAGASWSRERPRKQNVVVLIMESFGQEYMGLVNGAQGFTPFLDSLAARGLFFTDNYANGRRTMVAMQSILAGLPPLMSEPLVRSPYAGVRTRALPETLGRHGYRTAFFHGGHNGTMYFDQYARLTGFQEYFGFNEYPAAKRDDDGAWGISDDPFLQFMVRQLSGGREPFLAAFYSLTSHHPYPVPAAFRGRFPRGPQEILESIGYADYSLAHFFAEAEKQPWYRDTLFVITGDHTEKPLLQSFDNEIGRYRVPLIFFHPSQAWPHVDTTQPTQHADIVASVLDFLGIDDGESLQFGRSVFRSGERQVALYNTVDYFLLDRAWSLRFHPPKKWFLYDHATDPALRAPLRKWPPQAKALRSRLLATLQYFNNGLIEDSLLLPNQPQAGGPALVSAPRGSAR